MDRFIYLTIKENTSDTDAGGLYYPDIMTFPINRFKYTVTPKEITLTEQAIARMDLLTFNYYNISDYDDMLLWLNNVEYKTDLVPGTKFLLPDKDDLERFYIDFIL
jgi:hypothetical protein